MQFAVEVFFDFRIFPVELNLLDLQREAKPDGGVALGDRKIAGLGVAGIDVFALSNRIPAGELWIVMDWRVTSSFPLRAEHRQQMMARDVFTLDLPPLHKDVLCEPHRIPDIGFNNPPTAIVIGPLPVLLKLLEGSHDVEQFLFNGRRILLVLWGERGVSHRAVVEHPAQPCPLILEFPMLNKILDEEMKDRIVSSRNSATH
jgi:hypothetical protein